MLNVKDFIAQNHPNFASKHRRSAAALSKFLGLLFYEERFQQFERMHPNLSDFDFVDAVLRYFDFDIRLREQERLRIPSEGRIVVVANHPIGSLDGLALLNLIRKIRPDVKVVANSVLSAIKPLGPLLLPVNNMGGQTPRQNLENIKKHLVDEGALIIFPAGEVSRFGPKGIKDAAWNSGFVKIATATESPVLPIYVEGRNSLFFYSLSFLAKPLSTVWLVREMFKQNHRTIDARVGSPVPPDVFNASEFSAQKVAQLFRKHVYRIGRSSRPVFKTIETVAPPESKLLVRRELQGSEVLGKTHDGKVIYLTTMSESPCVMREIGRLRELTFRLIGEGTGLPRDMDRYDSTYSQLVLWDDNEWEIAGAYRLGLVPKLLNSGGLSALYTHSLFQYGQVMQPYLQEGLEMGRSFVQRKYQGKYALDYLWCGVGAYLKRHPQIRYLFGPASVSRLYGNAAIAEIAYVYSMHCGILDLDVAARNPFVITAEQKEAFDKKYSACDFDKDVQLLKDSLAERELTIPTLFKHYANVAERGGVAFSAFNIDPEFADCVDAFVMVDLAQLKPHKRKRYLEERG